MKKSSTWYLIATTLLCGGVMVTLSLLGSFMLEFYSRLLGEKILPYSTTFFIHNPWWPLTLLLGSIATLTFSLFEKITERTATHITFCIVIMTAILTLVAMCAYLQPLFYAHWELS